MVKKKLLLSLLSVIVALGLTHQPAIAQAQSETDPRFHQQMAYAVG